MKIRPRPAPNNRTGTSPPPRQNNPPAGGGGAGSGGAAPPVTTNPGSSVSGAVLDAAKAAGKSLAGQLGTGIGQFGGVAAGTAVGKLLEQLKQKSADIYEITYVPPDIASTPYYFELSVADYKRSGPISIGALKSFQTFHLPLPMQLVDGKSINFQDDKGLMPDAANKFQQSQAGTAASAISGMSVNQLMVVVLDRPMFKSFELTWKFVPKNDKESDILKKFIWQLNQYTSPGLTGGGAFFSFPKIFRMAFRAKNSTDGNHLYDTLYRFKPAIVEKMRVNFAAGGMPAFYRTTNAPESVEISLSFKELEYWVSSDYLDQKTNPYAGSNSAFDNVSVESIVAQLKKFFPGS